MAGEAHTLEPDSPARRPFMAFASSWVAAAWLIAGVTVARIVYIAFLCPFNLIEDEAHYWEWARRLEWSYYSKGPGVGWTIALSRAVLGDSEFAVRLPAALASVVTATCLWLLARDITRSGRVAFLTVVCYFLTPLFQASGIIMTIDGPYSACWALAALAAWRAIADDRRGWWLVLGVALGLGLMYKYTILLAAPGIIALLLMAPRSAAVSRRPGARWPWVFGGLCLMLAGLAPIAVWNAQHDWVTVRHLLGHLGVKGGDMPVVQGTGGGWKYEPRWTLEFIGTQIGLVGPLLIVMIAGAITTLRRPAEQPRERLGGRYLVAMAAPILLFYLAVSFVTGPEGNWAMAAYITLFIVAAQRITERMDLWFAGVRRFGVTATRAMWHATLVVGLATGLIAPRLDLLAKIPEIGKLVPLGRVTGAEEMARDVERLLEELRVETGLEPFVISQHYGRASQLAFYMKGRPTVYSASSLIGGGRKTQYDMWSQTDLRLDHGLQGRPAVVIGGDDAIWTGPFERVETVGRLEGDRKRGRDAHKAYGYTGVWPRN